MRTWWLLAAWTAACLGTASAACLEREPNDDPAKASPVGSLGAQGTLSSANDVDWFVLGGQQGTRAFFALVHDYSVSFKLEVFSGGRSVGTPVAAGAIDTYLCEDTRSPCTLRVSSLRGQGAYSILIAPLAGAPFVPPAASGSPSIVAPSRPGALPVIPGQVLPGARPGQVPLVPTGSECEEREVNDSTAQATVTQCKVLRGTIATPRDTDWFAVDGLGGRVWILTLTHDPKVDLDFMFYGDDRAVKQVTGPKTGSSAAAAIQGRCYIGVSSAGQNWTGKYALFISGGAATAPKPPAPPPAAPPATEAEPNSPLARATRTASNELRGTISPHGDEDWWLWEGDGGLNPMFTIRHEANCNIDFEVRQANGAFIANKAMAATGTQSGDNMIIHNAPNKCAIRVWSPSGTGSYTLLIGKT